MEYLQLQGRFGLFKPRHSYFPHTSKNHSSLVLGIIVFLHLVLILLALNEKAKQRESLPEKFLHMTELLPEAEEPIEPLTPDLIRPDLIAPLPIQLNLPPLDFLDSTALPTETPVNEVFEQTFTDSSAEYENVFDPKLRQKLLDAKRFNLPNTAEKTRVWTAIDGRTYIEMGDGICMVSMPKVDSRQRGTDWGATTCGKTNSEKAMDRVMADYGSRKLPKK